MSGSAKVPSSEVFRNHTVIYSNHPKMGLQARIFDPDGVLVFTEFGSSKSDMQDDIIGNIEAKIQGEEQLKLLRGN